tara:strand:- start:32 stop:607 length:576 start_codon:yes stop_codon:yes gene_type:complete
MVSSLDVAWGLSTDTKPLTWKTEMNINQIQINEAPKVTLPVGVKREGKVNAKTGKRSDLGVQYNFKTDESGNPVASPANLRKFYKEQKGLKGNALTAKVNEVWRDNEQMDRAMFQIFGNWCFERGLRMSLARVNKNERKATITLEAATEAKGKTNKVEQALVRAAVAMQEKMQGLGVTLPLEECLKVVKGA